MTEKIDPFRLAFAAAWPRRKHALVSWPNGTEVGNTSRLGVHCTRLAVLATVALLARWSAFGYPDYHIDETFYLMTGDAMRHGALPYVDIWDRKPLGLFLFYAVLASISATVWSYQCVALVFVTATAMLVTGLARRWSDEAGAVLAGAFYIAWLEPLTGGGGQSPIFYTLFVVGAVCLLVRSMLDREEPVAWSLALAAALLCGLAIWFKPTALFESLFVLLGFGWLDWRRRNRLVPPLALLVAMSGLIALPTLGGFVWYAALGHFDAMWQATIASNFHKSAPPSFILRHTVGYLLQLTMLLWSCAMLGLNRANLEKSNPRFATLIHFWLIAALTGFFVVPNFYSHYALPLVPVLAVSAAPYFGKRPLGPILAVCATVWALYAGQSLSIDQSRDAAAKFDRIVATVRANMPNGTLFLFNTSPWLYHETGARRLSRFVFPQHLSSYRESEAIGADPADEVRHILDQRPDVIIIEDNMGPDYNRQTMSLVLSSLDRDYTIVCSLPGRNIEQEFHFLIFARTRQPDRSHCPPGGPRSLHLLPPNITEANVQWH